MGVRFNGTSDYLYATSVPVSALPFTFSAWGLAPSAIGASSGLMAIGLSSGANDYAMIRVLSGGTVNAVFRDAAAPGAISPATTNAITVGQWFHIAGTFRTNNASVWLNGRDKTSASGTSGMPSVDRLAYGALVRNTVANYFPGVVAHAAIWSVELTDAEILELALGADPRSIRRNSLVEYRPFSNRNPRDNEGVKRRTLTAVGSPVSIAGPRALDRLIRPVGRWIPAIAASEPEPDPGASAAASVTIQNLYGETSTDRVVVVPLSSLGVNLTQFGDGRSLEYFDSDGETSLAHQLLSWGQTLGLHLDEVRSSRLTDGTYTWNAAVRFRFADLEDWADGPHMVWAAGDSVSANWHGELNVYDNTGTRIGSIPTGPNDDYVMGFDLVDVDGDGKKEILLSTRYVSHTGYVLDQAGAVKWSWDHGVSTYTRMVAAGDMAGDETVQVAFGVSDGNVSLREGADGTELWTNDYTSNNASNATIQGGYIVDPTGGGTKYLYFTQGSILRKVAKASATPVWTFTHAIQGAPVSGNFYECVSGFFQSPTTRSHVMAYSAMPGVSTSNICWLLCVNDSGSLVWEKPFVGSIFNMEAYDFDGDGYDEMIVGFEFGQDADSHGGFMVLNGDGDYITGAFLPAASRSHRVADVTGSGDIRLVAHSKTQAYFYRLASSGATVQVTVPSTTEAEESDTYLAVSEDSELIPAFGAYHWDLTGSDGSAVPDSTTYGAGTWTIESNKIETADSGNTSQLEYLDFALIDAGSFEFEFAFSKPAQGDGLAADYYVGCWYGATDYTTDRPYGFYLVLGAKGNLTLSVRQEGTGTTLGTIFNSASSGLTFDTDDTLRARVVWSGNDHSVAVNKNDAGWVTYVRATYSGTGNITGSGSISLVSQRGQSRFWDLQLRTLPRAYGGAGLGFGPYAEMAARIVATRLAKWYPQMRRR